MTVGLLAGAVTATASNYDDLYDYDYTYGDESFNYEGEDTREQLVPPLQAESHTVLAVAPSVKGKLIYIGEGAAHSPGSVVASIKSSCVTLGFCVACCVQNIVTCVRVLYSIAFLFVHSSSAFNGVGLLFCRHTPMPFIIFFQAHLA